MDNPKTKITAYNEAGTEEDYSIPGLGHWSSTEVVFSLTDHQKNVGRFPKNKSYRRMEVQSGDRHVILTEVECGRNHASLAVQGTDYWIAWGTCTPVE